MKLSLPTRDWLPPESNKFDLQRIEEPIQDALLKNKPEVDDVPRLATLKVLLEKALKRFFDSWL